MHVSRLRCTFFVLLAATSHMPQAVASSTRTSPAATGKAAATSQVAPPATPQTPFEKVIGSHLAEWAKQAAAGRKGTNAAVKNEASGVRVMPPAFVGAPYLRLYAPIGLDFSAKLANPVAADLNNDGKIDYVNVELDGTINTLLNPGSYTNLASLKPLAQNISAVGKPVGIAQVVVADMNGDGNADLVGLDGVNSNIVMWLGNGDGTFGNAVYYPVAPVSGATWAETSGTLVVADFNGDGKPDVATIETSAYNPMVTTTTITELTFLNQGDGILAAGKEVDTTVNAILTASIGGADLISADGLTPSGIAFALTNSGTTNPGTYIYVISSNGDGSFTAPITPSAPLLSAEGNSILTTSNLTTEFPSARGSASLSRNGLKSSNSFLGAGIPLTDVVIVTGDGAIYNVSCSAGVGNPTLATVLAGNPQNLGGSSRVFPTSPTGFPLTANSGLVIADFNGDGYQDILTTTPANAYIFLNTGNRSFDGAPTQVTGSSPGDIVAADFDNSGFPSFLWADYALAQVGYYQNLGTVNVAQAGTFFAAPTVAGPSTNGGTNYFTVGGAIRVQATSDVNGDGLQDVIATDESYVYLDGLAVHRNSDIVVGVNNGAGIGTNESNGFSFKTLISGIDQASLGNDPYLEPVAIKSPAGTTILIVTEEPAALYTVTYDGVSKVSAPRALKLGGLVPLCNFYYADAGDVNGDGITDIVAAYAGDALCTGTVPGSATVNSGFFTFLGNGDGTFQAGQFTTIGNELYKVKLINFTGGMPDVVAVDSYSPPPFFRQPSAYHTYLIPGNGDGTFQAANAVDVAPNYIVSDIVPGDFNMDGKQDLTLTTEGQYDTGSESVLPNTMGALLMAGNGDRTFGQGQLVDQGIFPATAVYADFNGDGLPDLAISQYIGTNSQIPVPSLEIFPNLGGAVFGPSFSQFIEPFPFEQLGGAREFGSPLFAGAFGKSGSSDLLFSNAFDTSVFINEGAPTLQVTATPESATQTSPVTLSVSLVQEGSVISSATGAVTFSINGTQLGSSSLSSGTATFVTTALPVGTDLVSAAYSGDAGDNPASGSVSVTIAAPPPVTPIAPLLTMTASSSTLSLSAGATGSVVLSLAANQTFSGTVSLACTGLPAEASCTANPASMTLAAMQTNNATVVIATTAKNNNYQASNNHPQWRVACGGLSLAGLFFFAVPRRRRIPRVMGMILIGLLSFGSLAALTGCGGGDQYPGTPSGTYNLTVTATSGSTTLTQIITLTIN